MSKLKGAWKSLTIWINACILACIPYIDGIMQAVRDNLPGVASYLTPEILKWLAVFILIANIILRFRTSKSLADK